MRNLYEHYLSIPKYTVNSINIYTKGWCVIYGRRAIPPAYHRHYTFNEFVEALNEKEDLREFLMNKK